MVFKFTAEMKARLADKLRFEVEDANAAPEPSFGCRIRNQNDVEFTLLYLPCSEKLLVAGEVGVCKRMTADEFLIEFPQLISFLEYDASK